MAASSKKNDFIQIVMLTFFLCSVFFAGLGIFFSAQVDGPGPRGTAASRTSRRCARSSSRRRRWMS